MAKVVVALTLETTLEYVDDGYLGESATVEAHIKRATDALRNTSLMVKTGSADSVVRPFSFTIKSVTIVPKEQT